MVMAVLSCLSCIGASISGIVRFDKNGDGWPSPDEPGLPGMLVSDGYGFAVTDANGRYTLQINSKAKTVYVHRTESYTADVTRFWHRLSAERTTYDFLLHEARPVTGDTLTMVAIGDSETHELSFMEQIRAYFANHPEVNLFINAGDISARSPLGMEVQRDMVNAATMGGIPVVYACGNHDVDFRGRGLYGSNCPYMSIFGPWWESFELSGFLFVVVPIYNSWGAPIQYDMLDCGDWLKAICRRFPDKKKILVCHDLPDWVGFKMASHDGDVVFDDEHFVCAIYGHKHCNVVRKYPSGRKSFCVSAPNKGGEGCFAPSFRVVTLDRKTLAANSELFFMNAVEHLELVTPRDGMFLHEGDNLIITADAYCGGDEIASVTATKDGEAVELSRISQAGWQGRTAWMLSGGTRITLAARTKSGGKIVRNFAVADGKANRLAWATQLPATIAMADLKLVNGLLVVAVCDDANAENGGLYAILTKTGEIVWHYSTGYGIRNNFATDGKRIYAIDTHANIHAVDVATGRRTWLNESDPSIGDPVTSGLACQDGIVVGGYGRHLRGIRAENGITIWNNTAWEVEDRTEAEDKLALSDGSVFVLSRLNGLYRHDLKTGDVIWRYKTLFAESTALPDGDAVWLIGSLRNLLRLNMMNGGLLAEYKSYPCAHTTAAPLKLPNGLLLIASGDNGLGAFNPTTGKDEWRFMPKASITPTGDYITGNPPAVTATPFLDDEALWVGANDGRLYKLNVADGVVVEEFVIGMPILNGMCADGGHVYVSDCCGRIMAIRKR